MNKLISKLLLPTGNVSPHYYKYMKWSFASNVLVSMQTAMSTHSMLDVVGNVEGDGYRTINYIGKDVIGQLGALAYISKMSEKADKKPGDFLIYSNIVQQTSFILMSTTPLMAPGLFLPIAGVSNLMSNVSFTGYGAMNAKCIQVMADNNVGEIYSKITTVNTMASSLGLTIGITICMFVPEHEYRTAIIPFIGMARVYTFNKAIEDIV